MKHTLPAAFLLSLSLIAHGLAADNKPKPPTGTPSTLPPTSPMLVVPPPDGTSAEGKQPAKLISSEMSGRDLEFFMKTVEAGREQAFFVDLLKTNASSEQIKALAGTLAADQAEENANIAKLVAQKGLTMSLDPTAAEKKAGEELEKLSGSNFDKAVMDKVVAASKQALAAYEDAAQSTDPQIKSFAARRMVFAEEKRHVVEKMTGAGSKTASQLFRHGGVSEGASAATPAATPASKGTPKSAIKSTPKATPTSAAPTPLPATKSAPAATPAAPDPPAVLAIPVATPPGHATPVIVPPAIVPSKGSPTPIPAK